MQPDSNAADETTLINWTTVINSKLDSKVPRHVDSRRNPVAPGMAFARLSLASIYFISVSRRYLSLIIWNLTIERQGDAGHSIPRVPVAVKVLLEGTEFFPGLWLRAGSRDEWDFSFLFPNFFFILSRSLEYLVRESVM